MRIVYLHQYFKTREMDGGTRSFEMARHMVDAGHEVHMVTSHPRDCTSSPSRTWDETVESGIRVHWLSVPYSNHMSYRERIRSFACFALRAMPRAARIRGDVIFATSTPLTIALPGVWASWRTGAPLVFEVRDLWPEAPIELGALQFSPARWLAHRIARTAYRRSTHIVALSPGARDRILQVGVAPSKVSVVPNASDLDLFSPNIDGQTFRELTGLSDAFVVLYFGTVGYANGLDLILDAARELERRRVRNVVWLILGDGRERKRLEGRARSEGLRSVRFVGPVPKSEVPGVVAAADACLVLFRNLPILQTTSPNKFFDSIAAGRPVITNVPGWLQQLVTTHRAGVFVEPEDAAGLADYVLLLRNRPALRRELGANGRRLAETQFSRGKLANNVLQIIERAAVR